MLLKFFSDLLFGSRKAREHALQKGIEVTDLKRPVQKFAASRFGQSQSAGTEEIKLTEYKLKRPTPTPFTEWSVLNRAGQCRDLPEGWKLWPDKGLKNSLVSEIMRIIEVESQYSELLEFEGREDAICAYWEEHGGQKGAKRIVEYLGSLRAAGG